MSRESSDKRHSLMDIWQKNREKCDGQHFNQRRHCATKYAAKDHSQRTGHVHRVEQRVDNCDLQAPLHCGASFIEPQSVFVLPLLPIAELKWDSVGTIFKFIRCSAFKEHTNHSHKDEDADVDREEEMAELFVHIEILQHSCCYTTMSIRRVSFICKRRRNTFEILYPFFSSFPVDFIPRRNNRKNRDTY